MRRATGPVGQGGLAGMRGSRIAIAPKPRHRSLPPGNRDRSEDHIGPDVAQCGIVQPDAFHIAGTKILDHDIRPGNQATRDIHAARVAQIDRDALLGGIGLREKGRSVMVARIARKGRRAAAQIQTARGFDHDHRCAIVGKVLGGARPGAYPTEIGNLEPIKRAHPILLPSLQNQFTL